MSNLNKSLNEIKQLEKLSQGGSFIHSLNPLSKIIVTVFFLLTVASVGKYDVSMLVGFLFYPVVLIELSNIPKIMLFKRVAVTLPFCLFMGISNLILDKGIIFYVGQIKVTYGMLSCTSIIIKVILMVMSVYILVATTSMEDIFNSLRKIKIPKVIVVQLLLSYRYISVILNETINMYTAYSLRSGNAKGVKIGHMGTFLGQILLKSFNRAEEIYMAMKCRGFDGIYPVTCEKHMKLKDYIYVVFTCSIIIFIRVINISIIVFYIVN